jgi:hypothetical protein
MGPTVLPGSVKGQDLALLPAPVGHIGEHSQQVPVHVLGDKRRIVLRMDQLHQTGHTRAAMPGQERLGSRLVGGLSQTDPARTSLLASIHRVNSGSFGRVDAKGAL